MQLLGCKYICNFRVAQIYLQLFSFGVNPVAVGGRGVLVVIGGIVKMTPPHYEQGSLPVK
jgi:hypothetical protein